MSFPWSISFRQTIPKRETEHRSRFTNIFCVSHSTIYRIVWILVQYDMPANTKKLCSIFLLQKNHTPHTKCMFIFGIGIRMHHLVDVLDLRFLKKNTNSPREQKSVCLKKMVLLENDTVCKLSV